MRENGSFPENTNIVDTLDFYFQCCSMQVSSRSMSTLAATFANSGVCPHNNGEQFFTSHTIKNSLSLMHSCGMYDFSGEFAFSVGLPAKSGVSGVIWLVIPNLMGIVIWSPLLDINGNSVRGIEFCKELVKNFNFHNYDNLIGMSDKVDPRTNATKSAATKIFNLIYAASHNSVNEIKRLLSYGVDINASDYDKRTALHLAVAEQNIEATTYLINNGADPKLKDRWGATPLSEAKKTKNPKLLAILADNDT
jgi:glutaminase